jgi:L-malate glycosyltransferase
VAIVQRSLRQYRAGFFEALRGDLAAEGIELLLFHSNPTREQDPRDDPLDLPWAAYLPRRKVPPWGETFLWQSLEPALRGADLVIVEQAAALLLNYRLLWRQRRGLGRVAFWGHGQSFADDPSKIGETLKAWTSTHAHWWFAYTELSADVVQALGFDRGRITVVENSIDTAQLARDLKLIDEEAVDRLRTDLDLGDGPVGLFMGMLRPEKKLDLLFEAADHIHAQRPDFRLLVVGSGPLEDEVGAWVDVRPWIHHLGSLYGPERAAVLTVADVMLLPGWVGLAIVDSFVAGVPLVTSRDSAHPPEIAYLRDGENGLMVADGGDPSRYAGAVVDLLSRPDLLSHLVDGCRADATRYSVEAMSARFTEGIRQALATP